MRAVYLLSSRCQQPMHLVMPDVHADDAFLQTGTELLHDRFDIEHVTLQVVRVPFNPPCGLLVPTATRRSPTGE